MKSKTILVVAALILCGIGVQTAIGNNTFTVLLAPGQGGSQQLGSDPVSTPHVARGYLKANNFDSTMEVYASQSVHDGQTTYWAQPGVYLSQDESSTYIGDTSASLWQEIWSYGSTITISGTTSINTKVGFELTFPYSN